MPDTIKDILAIEFAGNMRDDLEKFNRIDRFVFRADTSLADKIKAERFASLMGMGEPLTQTDDEIGKSILESIAQRKAEPLDFDGIVERFADQLKRDNAPPLALHRIVKRPTRH